MVLKWNDNSTNRGYGFNLEQISPRESIFHAIYFVDSLTGALLVSNKYSIGLSDKNEDLISGFLNAINMFIREIKNNKNDEIQEINFRDSRILYEKMGRLLCIVISKKTELHVERQIIHEILNDFYYRFENEINNFNGYIDKKIINYQFVLKNLDLNLFHK
ncbi:MAG TPA: hypothetical protein VGB37_10265 [Candidatus Lokiarchaeia archaeon]